MFLYLSVKRFLGKNKRERRGFRLLKTKAEFPNRKLLVAPWLLGFWLGDGRKRECSFAVNKYEFEILDALKQYAEKLGKKDFMKDFTERN